MSGTRFFNPIRVRRSKGEIIVNIHASSPDHAVRCMQDFLDDPAQYGIGWKIEAVYTIVSGAHRSLRIQAEAGLPGAKRQVRITIHDVISVGYKGAAAAESVASILVMMGIGGEYELIYDTITTPNSNRDHADAWLSRYYFGDVPIEFGHQRP